MTNYEIAEQRIAKAKETKAEKLDLEGLGLTELPLQIIELAEHLRELNLNWNQVGDKGAEHIARLQGLTELYLIDNSIGEKGAEHIARLQGLTLLNLSNNSIGDKGAEHIARLQGLTWLELWNSSIGEKGAEHISRLQGLTSLDLWGNSIGEKGAEHIARLQGLTSLQLYRNSIGEKGAEFIARLQGLTELNLSVNSIGDKGAEHISRLQRLTSLDLMNNSIGDNGAEHIARLQRLTWLNLAGNSIGDNGAEHIARLEGLTSLNLGGNSIGDNGVEYISSLKRLTELKLYNCSINEKGAEYVSGIKTLTSLNLSENFIGNHGVEFISRLQGVTELHLSDNYIGDNGAEHISRIEGLTRLRLSNNSIGEKGAEHISRIQGLTDLYLSGNSIGDIGAKYLSNLKWLTTLDLRKNSIEEIPEALLTDAKGFLAYFGVKDRVPNTVVKMVLMGNGKAGKTSLGNYLMHRKYPHGKGRTHGILHWVWKIDGATEIKVNILDFGGQDYYHATHNLFIDSDRNDAGDAVYLLLWDMSTQEDNKRDGQDHPIPYWLGNVRHQSSRAPIWSVQTKMDITDSPGWLNTEWVSGYGVTGQYHISLEVLGKKKVKDTEVLKPEYDRFEQHLANFLRNKATQVLIPQSWVAIRDRHLPEWRKEGVLLPLRKFKEKCLETVKDISKAVRDQELAFDGLLLHLHSAGEILRFDDIDSLKDTVFIDPIRLTEGVYQKLLSKEALKEGTGVFTLNADDPEYDVLSKYVTLLEHKELIFEREKGVYVAPQFLPEDAHSYHFSSLIPASFVLRFNGYFPRHRITQFITRYASKSENPLYWKFGAFFKKDGVHAMVRIDLADSALVYVHVGPEKGRYGLMKELFAFFTGLEDLSDEHLKVVRYKSDVQRLLHSVDVSMATGRGLERPKASKEVDLTLASVELSVDGERFAALNEWKDAIDTKSQYIRTANGDLFPLNATVYQLLGGERVTPKRIFLSYSHKDEAYKEELDAHFSALKRSGKVETWNDRRIEAGELWDNKILGTLGDSDIFIALLSPDFMASDYIWKKEIPLAKERGCHIIPVFLRACDFEDSPFDPRQGYPKDEQSTEEVGKKMHTQWIVGNKTRTRDMCYLEVVQGIKGLLNK